jgi:hypothetical protein
MGIVAPTLAVALLLAAAVVREPSVPRAEELVGLAQTGGGLALHTPQWDLGGRLSDQINKWSKDGSGGEGARLKAAGPGFVPAAGTQQLAQVGAGLGRAAAGGAAALSHKIKTAVDTLRLSDFLTGLKPKAVQRQVQALYEKMDPHDTTGWMSREQRDRASPAQVQARRVKDYKTMLQKALSTTRDQDSPKAIRMRKELRALLKHKAAVKRSLNAAMRNEMHHISTRVWTPRPAKNGDDADYLIKKIASPEDRHANYAQWLRSAKGGSHVRRHRVGSPRLSAGGQLEWRRGVHAKLQQKQARLQKLSEDDTAHSRMQVLSEDDSKVGASEIAMRQILGKAKKAAHSYVYGEEEKVGQRKSKEENKQAEVGRDFAAPHQQLAKKPSGLDIVSDAEEGVHPEYDTPESIQQRAAYKVSRWMGGGYTDVYGR